MTKHTPIKPSASVLSGRSENPVVMVRIFAGKDHKEFKIEEYDNRRTRDGYSGELNTVVELDPSFMEESLAYVIQVEDDVRLKSDPVNGKIQIVKARDPYGVAGSSYMGMPQPPMGGCHNSRWAVCHNSPWEVCHSNLWEVCHSSLWEVCHNSLWGGRGGIDR
ncbi:MAG: hypothetical protein MZV70_24205 [Desulfobacterales bacterium]|nr:hypothetical protein [Desulfobacterales bacterium]